MLKNLSLSLCLILISLGGAYSDTANAHSLNISQETYILHSQAPQLPSKVLSLGLTAYQHATETGIVHKSFLTIVDYTFPSSKKRMWVFNIKTNTLLFHTYVTHARRSGGLMAHAFSNQIHSDKK